MTAEQKKEIIEETPETESNEISGFFATKIFELLENQYNEKINLDLEKYLKKFFDKIIKIGLKNNKKKFHFLNKYFENEAINGKFEQKIQRYFPIHKENIINAIIENFGKKKEEYSENQSILKSDIKNFFKNYIKILFLFGEKIKISELDDLLQNDKKVDDLYYKYDTKLRNLCNNQQCSIDPVSTLRTILKQTELSKENEDTEDFETKTQKTFENQVKNLFDVFYKWKKSPYIDEKNIEPIQKTALNIFELILTFKENNIAFKKSFPINSIQDKDFINNFIQTFETKLKQHEKYTPENAKLFKDFLEISKINGDFSEIFSAVKEYKKNKYKKNIPIEKEELDLEKLYKIDLEQIDFNNWDNIIDKQQKILFFKKIFYKKNNKLILEDIINIPEEKNDEKINIFTQNILKEKIEKIKKQEENEKNQEEKIKNLIQKETEVIIKQFKKISKKLKTISSIENFINDDANDLNLLLEWWEFELKTKTLKKEEKKLTIENINDFKQENYGFFNIITRKLEEGKNGKNAKSKLDFFFGERLNNESINSIEQMCHNIKINFEKAEKEFGFKIENDDKKEIIFKKHTNLYIDENFSETDKKLKLGLLVCNKILSYETINDTEEKQYLKYLIQAGIVPENREKLTNKTKDNLAELKEFLKYVKYNAKKLNEMIEIGNNSRKKLKIYLPKNYDQEFTGIGPEKEFSRAMEKLILNHNGDFGALGDLSRMRITNDGIKSTIESIVDFIKKAEEDDNILQIGIINHTGDPFKKPEKASGYRDIKLLIKFSDGGVGEVQFQYKNMLEMKEKGLDFSNLENEKIKFIFDKLEQENSLFNQKELYELIKISKEKNINLPLKNILEKLSEKGVNIEENNLMSQTQISTQYIYDISRIVLNNDNLKAKLSRFERILADIAWGKTINFYLKNILDNTGIILN